MVHLLAPVLSFIFMVASLAAPVSPPADDSDPHVSKRWYSLGDDLVSPPGNQRAWPPGSDGHRTITYCYENVDAFNIMDYFFSRALDKWAPAIWASALLFAPDPACTQQGPCLCSAPDVEEVTLHLMLGPAGCRAMSTIGYRDRISPKQDPGRPRHFVQWPPSDAQLTEAMGIRTMTHELGKRPEDFLSAMQDLAA